jgi:hypothetical protein
MRIKVIEIEGSGGHLTIERQVDRGLIQIRSTIKQNGQYATKRWDIEPRIDDEALFAIATEVQQRTDGQRGTNSMIHDYYRELQRFQA